MISKRFPEVNQSDVKPVQRAAQFLHASHARVILTHKGSDVIEARGALMPLWHRM